MSTSQLNAACTMVKADAACITSPSDIEPSRNFGAHRMIGSTGATMDEPCDTMVVFMCWSQRSRQRRSTVISERSRPARSSSSPPSSAMLSPFSRTRVS